MEDDILTADIQDIIIDSGKTLHVPFNSLLSLIHADASIEPSRRGKRGRPLGSINIPKPSRVYSSNPNTTKSRERIKTFTEDEKRLEKSKINDAVAVRRARKKLQSSDVYKNATQDEQ